MFRDFETQRPAGGPCQPCTKTGASFTRRGNRRGGMKQPKANGTKPTQIHTHMCYSEFNDIR
jgi:hypothetical protein